MLSEECPLPDVSKQALLDIRTTDMMNIGDQYYNYPTTTM